jgi:hypothetical protein
MASTDPNLDAASAQAAQLSEILSLVNGGMRNFSRSQTLRALQEKQYLAQLEKLTGETGEAAKATAKKIKQEEEEIRHNDARNKAIADAFGKTVGALKQFASSAMTSSQSAYNSSEVFGAVAPTVSLMGNTIKAVTDVLATAVSSIPFFGGLFTAADKAIGIAVDLTTQAMEIQLQNAQKLVNTYDNLSKTGLTFGGSLSSMTQTANDSGLKLDTFTKFVGTSAESLHQLGGGLGTASKLISKMGKSVIDTNDQLVVMYGSYDNLDSALATYASRAAGFGTDIVKNQDALTRGSKDYLYSLKELQELTGLSADKLKKDQEEREKNSAFQLALSKMDNENANRVNDTLSILGKSSPLLDKMGTELIQNNGNLIDTTNILTKQFFPATAKMTEELLRLSQTKGLSDTDFRAQRAAIISANADALKAESQRAAENFGALKVTGDATVTQINDIAAGILKSFSDLANFQKGQAEITRKQQEEDARAKAAKGGAEDTNTINVLAGLRRSLEDLGVKQDERILKLLPTTGKIAENLYAVQNKLIDKFLPGMDSVVEKFDSVITKLIDYINKDTKGSTDTSTPAKTGTDVDKAIRDAKLSSNLVRPDGTSYNPYAQNRPSSGLPATQQHPFGAVPLKGAGGSPTEPTAGGNTDQVVKDAAQLAFDYLKSTGIDAYVSAFNDQWHKTHKGSDDSHVRGIAGDIGGFGSRNRAEMDAINAKVNDILKKAGINNVQSQVDRSEVGDNNWQLHLQETNSAKDKHASADIESANQVAMNNSTIQLFSKINENMDRVASLLETHGGHLEAIANHTA